MKRPLEKLPEKDYLDYIDGLKGIAILMVLFFHVSLEIKEIFYFLNFEAKVERLSRGVHLFFIISGFSLLHSSSHWPNYRYPRITFYLKRFFRILPLWCLVVTLYHFFWAGPHSTGDYWATMFLYFGFSQYAWSIMIVPVAWSLFVEESFYVFFPLWKKIIRAWKIAFGALVLSYIVAIGWYSMAPAIFTGSHYVGIHPLGNYYAFFAGIFLFYLNERLSFKKIRSRYFSSFLNVTCVISVIVIFSYERMVGTIALSILFLAAFVPETVFGKIVRFKLIKQFGTCCYSIYVFHAPVLMLMKPLKNPLMEALGVINFYGELQVLIWFFVIAFISLCVGKVSWFLFEETSVRLGKIVINKVNTSDFAR